MKSIFRNALMLGVVIVLGTAATASAQDVTPNFGTTVPGSWFTDRYEPTTFSLTNATNGRNDVLNIGITSATDAANRGAQSATFYNTQGRQTLIAAPSGSYSFMADLWVDASWATNAVGSNNSVRTDMWGVAVNGANSPWDYPIIGFTNFSGVGLFRGYDVNSGAWINFANPVNYGAWNTLEVTWNAGTMLYSYYANGSLGGTVNGDGGAVGIGAMIMQAYNFNDPAILAQGNGSSDYTALWSNTPSEVVPEPATMTLLATGLIGMAGAARRRKRSTKA